MLLKYFTNLSIICLCFLACNTKVPNTKAHTDESNTISVKALETPHKQKNTAVIRSMPIKITQGGQKIDQVDKNIDSLKTNIHVETRTKLITQQ